MTPQVGIAGAGGERHRPMCPAAGNRAALLGTVPGTAMWDLRERARREASTHGSELSLHGGPPGPLGAFPRSPKALLMTDKEPEGLG